MTCHTVCETPYYNGMVLILVYPRMLVYPRRIGGLEDLDYGFENYIPLL